MDLDGTPPPPPGPPADQRPSAWRVTFEYDGDDVRIVNQQRVAMLAPPDDAALLERGRVGFWVEVQDASGKTLYQQVLHAPIRQDLEVFSPEPDALPQRVATASPTGTFQVVVPDLAGAHAVVLHGRPSPRELAERGPVRLVAGTLREPGRDESR